MDFEARNFIRAFLTSAGCGGLSRDELKTVAIKAVQALNQIDGAMPCLYSKQDGEGIKRGTKMIKTRCPVSHLVPVWAVGQHRNHGSHCFYGTSMVDGEEIILCPHTIDEEPPEDPEDRIEKP